MNKLFFLHIFVNKKSSCLLKFNIFNQNILYSKVVLKKSDGIIKIVQVSLKLIFLNLNINFDWKEIQKNLNPFYYKFQEKGNLFHLKFTLN